MALPEDPLKEWLDSIASDSTRKLYEGRFRLFLAYVNPTLRDENLSVEERDKLERETAKKLLEERRRQIADPDLEPQMSRLLKKFYVDMIKGRVRRTRRLYRGKIPKKETRRLDWTYKPKSAQAIVNAVRQFFRYFGRAYEVDFRITEQQLKPRVTKRKYEFSTEELRRILEIASLRDKALILLGATSGWGASDIVALRKDVVERILDDPEGKYFWFTKRKKTNSDMYLCLTSETRKVLKTYIKTLPPDQEPLFAGYDKQGNGKRLRAARLDYILKDLAEKAGIRSRNPALMPIRFHCLRQYFSRKYRGRPEVKELCLGHIPRYEGAYSVTEQEIWEDFQTQDENLRIQEAVSADIAERVQTQQQIIEALTKQLEEQNGQIRRLMKTVAKLARPETAEEVEEIG